ncbi:hypothetical protein GCM10010123_29850 [Pilimelia anulata]|uniref:Uncharacterized protein n=1 Tax=Pilimelia anulata TaxID=53371 RepID=A0A8J3BEB9_9ACTN|nr:hypothetical protein [Pilimelia anulata]GGJ97802.1 hypothetical protein GCM10010123_29850 [Pilimelia anulata]
MDVAPSRRPGRARTWLAALAAVALLAGLGALAAYRTLRPAEVVTLAQGPYPSGPGRPTQLYGRLANAPLFIGTDLRVYADKFQVKADGPAHTRYQTSPYWALRRWPQQVLGVVATDRLAVTRWSDGLLTATDLRTGALRWRTPGPAAPAGAGYTGRRDGATTVYTPAGMHATADTIVVAGATETMALDHAGAVRWRRPGDRCLLDAFTTTGELLAVIRGCGPATIEYADPRTGARVGTWRAEREGAVVTPLGCGPARGGCLGVRIVTPPEPPALTPSPARPARPPARPSGAAAPTARPAGGAPPVVPPPPVPGAPTTAAWLLTAPARPGAVPRPVRAPGLDADGAMPIGRPDGSVLAATVADGAAVVSGAVDGRPRWRWRGPTAPVPPAADLAALLGLPAPAVPPVGPRGVDPSAPAVRHLLTAYGDSLYVSTAAGRAAELDLRTGALLAGITLDKSLHPDDWVPGFAVGGPHLVVFEQLRAGASASPDDDEYYLTGEPVIIAGPFYDRRDHELK